MKDQYAGDIGDYVKLGMLQSLFFDRPLAVNWFRTADDVASGDGRFTEYAEWRDYDPHLFDYLHLMIRNKDRSIDNLQRFIEAPGREFFDDPIDRPSARSVWFARFDRWLTVKDVVFLDPDNGIGSDQSPPSPKSVTIDEIDYLLDRVKTLVIYHHQTRAKGGHVEEINRIGQRLAPSYSCRSACAIRAGRRSPRVFFIIGADMEIWQRAEKFCENWSQLANFYPLSSPPDHLGLTSIASAFHRVDEMERRGLI